MPGRGFPNNHDPTIPKTQTKASTRTSTGYRYFGLTAAVTILVLLVAILIPSAVFLSGIGRSVFTTTTSSSFSNPSSTRGIFGIGKLLPRKYLTTTTTTKPTTPNLITKMSSATTTTTPYKTPVYFISHGGPNVMYERDHPAYSALQALGREITQGVLGKLSGGAEEGATGGEGSAKKTPQPKPKPKGVVVFSAHWQAGKRKVQVNVGEGDGLIYDFYGFPAHYYKETYPHKGSKPLAGRVLSLLKEAGIEAEGVERDIDHGVWAGFKCLFDPKENPLTVPIVQVSLFDNEDPGMHYDLGRAIAKLREEGVVVICSGMAVHNLRDLRLVYGTNTTLPYAVSFDNALRDAVTLSTGSTRKSAMEALMLRGDARQAHPEFDHLLPVYVAAGAAEGEKGHQVYTKAEMSFSWAQYRFGDV